MSNEEVKELEASVIVDEELEKEKNIEKKYTGRNSIKLQLKGLDSASSGFKIEEKVNALEGVKESNLNFLMGVLMIIKDEKTDKDKLIKEVIDIVREAEAGVVVDEMAPEEHHLASGENSIKLHLAKLDSPTSAVSIEQKVRDIKGVKEVNLNFETGIMMIEKDENTNRDSILNEVVKVVNNSEPGIVLEEV